jgi:spore germination cell wall hydrolase CwlJ-like protein
MRSTIVAALMCGLVASSANAEKCNTPQEEIEALAFVIYHEARGEDLTSQQLVGEVILNRVESENFPDSICEVIYQKGQFSGISTAKSPSEEAAWQMALVLAENLYNGEADFIDNGATHFLNPKAVDKMPNWTKRFERIGKSGAHVFYADGSVPERYDTSAM